MKTLATFAFLSCLSLAGASAGQAEIKLGVVGPLTGSLAESGAQLKNGADQAVQDVNASGGILGQKVSVLYGDDAAEPKQGVSVANNFAGDGVKFVIGHINSGVVMAASEVYLENGILEITPSATNPAITDRGMWNIFRTCGRDDQQGAIAGNYLAEHFKNKRVAIVHDKTTYGLGLVTEMKKALNAKGVKEVLYEGVNTGEKDYSALVSKIKTSRADLVYWGGSYTEGGLIVRQMRDQGVKAVLMGGDGIASADFAAIGGPGVEGTLMTFGPDPRTYPAAKAIVEKFRAKNFEPETFTLYSYAAVQVLKQAAEAAKSLDPKKIADLMHSGMAFKTVIGDISYDRKGDIKQVTYLIYVWKSDPTGKLTYRPIE